MIDEMQKYWIRNADHWVEWITIDKDGDVEGHDSKPSCEEGRWLNDGGASVYINKHNIPTKHPKHLIWQRPTNEEILEYKFEIESNQKQELARQVDDWRKVRHWPLRKRIHFLILGSNYKGFHYVDGN